MGTQGLISVVKDRQVIYKLVCGQNGSLVLDVAEEILGFLVAHPESGSKIAQIHGMGSEVCLVLITPTEIHASQPVGPRYRETFNDPWFNPRREDGTANYTAVVDLDARTISWASDRPKKPGSEHQFLIQLTVQPDEDDVDLATLIWRLGKALENSTAREALGEALRGTVSWRVADLSDYIPRTK